MINVPLQNKVGFGRLGINENPSLEQTNVKPLPEFRDKPIENFLWAPAPSSITYLIPSDTRYFTAHALVNAETQDGAIFIVKVDGKQLYASPLLQQGKRQYIRVKIPSGSHELELSVAINNNPVNDHAYWIDPFLRF